MTGIAMTGIRTRVQSENCCMRKQFSTLDGYLSEHFSTLDSVKNAAISLAVTVFHLYATGPRVTGGDTHHYTNEEKRDRRGCNTLFNHNTRVYVPVALLLCFNKCHIKPTAVN